MLLSLFPTSKAKVSGIGMAKKLKQNSYNAPEYKQQQKIQKDLGGALVSSPSGVWGGAPAEIEFGEF